MPPRQRLCLNGKWQDYTTITPKSMISTNHNTRCACSGVNLPKQKFRIRGLSIGSCLNISDNFNQPALEAASPCARYTFRDANGAAQSNLTRDKVAHSRVNHQQLLFGNWNILTRDGRSFLFLTPTSLLLRQIQLRLQSDSKSFSHIIFRFRTSQTFGNQFRDV